MTLTATEPAAPTSAPTSTAPTGGQLWRQLRWPLAALLALVVGATVISLLQKDRGGQLDPRSYAPGGSRAVAALAERQGTPVHVAGDVDQIRDQLHPDDRVVIADAGAVTRGEAARIASLVRGTRGASLLVVGAEAPDEYGLPVEATSLPTRSRAPRCPLASALRAGSARTGEVAYSGPRDATSCYVGSLLVLPSRRVTLLGSADLLTNDRLDQDGNASLGLALVSEHPDGAAAAGVVWFVPRTGRPLGAGDTAAGDKTIGDLLPRGLRLGAVQTAIALLVLALWRARRLGRVVTEPLPVVVRAAEAVEGRARLYRAAGARAQAAEALRSGARDRLARRLGLAPEPTPEGRISLVGTLGDRLGRDPREVDHVLFGPPPPDDPSLVRLADDLDRLTAGLSPEGNPS